ncbi:HamA C-terminal domain-containing protein [Pedobacter glucosidilyticus]|uniref:HamA C-terminal domain-containing protein n=1 Tax=Pedobacter glucosidilyticus TaxID=1122941 RepID=UPI0026F2FD22|nr:DUF1837 domain-containing protein [Pedobacter glucosidilyticus]
MSIDWEQKIKIDIEWTARILVNHFIEKSPKLILRAYTPKVTGTKFCCNALIEELGFYLTNYALSVDSHKKKINALKSKYKEDLAEKRLPKALSDEAQAFFGKKDPSTDGKYGELLLFALCESILKCKMVAHKIEGLTNGKDQVKGGDGIFLGNYEFTNGKVGQAIFIGEAKITQDRARSINEAFDSLNRFHDSKTQHEFNNMEFIVAHKSLTVDENDTDYEEIFERLTPGTEKFQNQVTVHPILLMYNTSTLGNLETKAADKEDLESLITLHLSNKKNEIIDIIQKKIESFPHLKKVYLDFFCFPFNDIDLFREGMYFNIHKVPYSKSAEV